MMTTNDEVLARVAWENRDQTQNIAQTVQRIARVAETSEREIWDWLQARGYI